LSPRTSWPLGLSPLMSSSELHQAGDSSTSLCTAVPFPDSSSSTSRELPGFKALLVLSVVLALLGLVNLAWLFLATTHYIQTRWFFNHSCAWIIAFVGLSPLVASYAGFRTVVHHHQPSLRLFRSTICVALADAIASAALTLGMTVQEAIGHLARLDSLCCCGNCGRAAGYTDRSWACHGNSS
jgi:hypothetical protein